MKTMKIYEPAMCCSTGLCGVGVNPELLRIATALDGLKKHGIIVERFNLNNAPQEFIKNDVVNAIITKDGVSCLPLVLVDGEIVLTKRYPTNEQLCELLGVQAEFLSAPKTQSSCCCGNGDKCC